MTTLKILTVLLLSLLTFGCGYVKNVQLLLTGDLKADKPTTIPFDCKRNPNHTFQA